MTTVVNNPAPATDNGASNFLIGAIVLVVLLLMFFYFGLPEIRRLGSTPTTIPAPQVIVPDKIDVNVKQTN